MFRVLRFAVTVALGLIGSVLAIVQLPLGLHLALGVVGITVGLTGQRLRSRFEASSSRRRETYLLPVALVFVEATAGLIAGLGWSGAAMIALVALSWPQIGLLVLDLVLNLLPSSSSMRSRVIAVKQGMPGPRRSLQSWPARLGAMSDGSICYAWARSSQDLQRHLPAAESMAIVLNRSYLLDELERRDPAGFANWTAGGPVQVDPRRFINSTASMDKWGHQSGSG